MYFVYFLNLCVSISKVNDSQNQSRMFQKKSKNDSFHANTQLIQSLKFDKAKHTLSEIHGELGWLGGHFQNFKSFKTKAESND